MIDLELEEEIPHLFQELHDIKGDDQVDDLLVAAIIRASSTSSGAPPKSRNAASRSIIRKTSGTRTAEPGNSTRHWIVIFQR